MTEEERNESEESSEQETDEQAGGGEVGPPEDIENDPAYNPEDENLKGIKGG